jgi:hypothetical protein
MVEIDDYVPARRYLAPFTQSPWHWDDEALVLVWADGQTIAFGTEVQQVLRRLSPRGLPPMTALVLLLAACRDTWKEASHQFGTMAGFLATVERGDLPSWLPDLLRRLDRVCALPSDLRNTPEAKAILAELVFEECAPAVQPAEAARVVQVLADSPEPGMLAPQYRRSRSFNDILREVRCLLDGLEKVDEETLRLRQRTGLDRPVEPAEIEVEPAQPVRDLIAKL